MSDHHEIHPSWLPALAPAVEALGRARSFIEQEEAAGHLCLPPTGQMLRALLMPMDDVRVLIVGQDPYPTPGNAVGLSFSVAPGVAIPASLANVFTELVDDQAVPAPTSGDLSPWAAQGVLLLNRVLTVRSGAPGSHRGQGWEEVTTAAVKALARRDAPLVAILWGAQAKSLAPTLGDVPKVMSPHPSPMSADRGFFGSTPFSRTNHLLERQGARPIDWRLP